MYWEYSPVWAGWWLMIRENGVTARCVYGPFLNDWEIQAAASVHDVPPPKLEALAAKGGSNA